MKIGVISDTHIPDRADSIPKVVLEAFKGVDMIIHTGDLVELAVLDELKAVCKNVKAVYGNMDSHEVKSKLQEKDVIKINGHKIGITHGYGNPNNLVELLKKIFKNDGVDTIVFGHSHIPMNEKKGNILFFNPGSATDKIFSPYNSYGILEVADNVDGKIVRI